MTGVPLKEVHERQAGELAPVAASNLSSPDAWFVNWATGNPGGLPGPIVNEHTAMNYAVFYSCVSLIAGTIASLPLKVYRRRDGGGQDEATEREEWNLLQNEFNPNTSAMTGREAGNAHLLTWGNSYAQIVRNKAKTKVLQLQPLGPDCVEPRTDASKLVYDVFARGSGKKLATLDREDVLHVPGLSFDSLVGYSTVRTTRSAVRAGVSQDQQAERFVTRGIRPPGAIQFRAGEKFKSVNDAIQYRSRFRQLHSTEDSDLQIMILEDGATWHDIGVDPDKAQLLDSRKFSRGEVCGLFHVPPFMVGDLEKSTSWGTGVEELTIGFVVYCLLKHIRRIEQEYNRKLFRSAPGYFCEHVLGGLLKGDSLKRAQSLEIMTRNGIITPNEWRKLEGFNPLPGGNVRYFPLNFGRVDESGEDIPPPTGQTAASTPAPAAVAPALRRVVRAAVGRCLGKEINHARRAAKAPGEFVTRIDEFYAAFAAEVEENVGLPLAAWAAAFPGAPKPDAAAWGAAHAATSKAALLAAAGSATPAELAAAVERVLAAWEADRAADAAAELETAGPAA